MIKIDRRDFLLHVAPLVAAPALILGSVSEMEAQIKNFGSELKVMLDGFCSVGAEVNSPAIYRGEDDE